MARPSATILAVFGTGERARLNAEMADPVPRIDRVLVCGHAAQHLGDLLGSALA
ncbi:hypothetical protein [Streptomyces sp. NPDC001774]